MRDLKNVDVDDVIVYLEEQLQAIEEIKDNNEDVEDELLRVEGMMTIAHHFNLIDAMQYSAYLDKIEYLKYSFD